MANQTFTLADYNLSPKPLVAGVARILREESPLMDTLNFIDVGALAVNVMREGSLPSVSWRRPGAAHGSTKGTKPTVVSEQAFSFGNAVDVDKIYVKDNSPRLYDPRTYWTEQTTKAMGREFNDAFINGDPAVNVDRPAGLFYRLRNDFTAQNLDASPALNNGGLDISPDAASLAANIQTFFDKLDKLIYSLAEHKADFIVCNDDFLTRYWSIARQSGLLKTTEDNLGREFYEYKGAKFIDAGFKIDDSSKIIANVELNNGTALTGGAATSIYAVRQGPELFSAWQEYAMDVQDLGLMNDGVTYRTLIDWVVGLAVSHPRSVARMYGLIAV